MDPTEIAQEVAQEVTEHTEDLGVAMSVAITGGAVNSEDIETIIEQGGAFAVASSGELELEVQGLTSTEGPRMVSPINSIPPPN